MFVPGLQPLSPHFRRVGLAARHDQNLGIATLGFSKENLGRLTVMLDSGTSVSFCFSVYYKSNERDMRRTA